MQQTSCTPRTHTTIDRQRARVARRRRADDAVVSQWLIEQMTGRDPLQPFAAMAETASITAPAEHPRQSP